jgi:cyclohexanecarboxylate-CoA ligase/acyl-CoA synthetase
MAPPRPSPPHVICLEEASMAIGSTDKIPLLSAGDHLRGSTYRANGWWQPKTLAAYLDEFASSAPDRVFVTDGSRSLTYADLQGEAYRFGAALRGLAVKPGDRVVVQLPNWAEFVVAYLALARIGAVLVPIMPIYRHSEVQYVLGHSEAVAVITCGTFRNFDYQQMYGDLRGACPLLRHLIVARGGETGDSVLAFDDLARRGSTDVPGADDLGPGAGPDEPHAVVYTSGTESRPKGCAHTWNSIGYNVRGLWQQTLRLTADDVMFMPSPVTHSTGLVLGVGVPLASGAALHLMDAWEPAEGLRRIEQYRCTASATATPFVQMALAAYDPDKNDVSTMRVWLCAGAPIPPAMVERVAAEWPECTLLPLWGCSEVMGGSVCSLDDPLSATSHSDGRAAFPGVELKILDSYSAEASPGVEGEICYRGPGRMLGYWGDPERTVAAIDEDGWYHTADLARMDEDGYVRITGRIKDIIIRGGSNISAREVEDHALTHPKVTAAAAIGVPDEVMGERVFLFVVASAAGEPSFEELVTYLKVERQIAPNKLPERFAVVAELPMTATGKIQKFELRRLALQHGQG